jgi:hypothetical protein
VDDLMGILLVGLFIAAFAVVLGWLIVLTPLYDFLQKHRVRALLRRIRQNTCTRCGYDLRENTHRCPECGGEIASTPERVNALLQMTADSPQKPQFAVVDDEEVT